jgi:aryl-alcohol dehydrogenase
LSTEAGEPVYSSFFGQSSLAQYAVASERNAIPVPDDVPLHLAGPLGCGLLTGAGAILNALRVRPGQTVVIFGAGAVGLSAIMTARICRAQRIVAVDMHDSRLALASELGATHVINAGDGELAERIASDLGPVDTSLDTTGVTEVMAAAVAVLAPGGVCGLVAIGGRVEFDPFSLVLGRTVVGIVEGNSNPRALIPQLIGWWRAGLYPFDSFVRTYPLSEVNSAVRDALSGQVIKPVLIP